MDADDALSFGPLPRRTVHLCVDMQRLFAEDTPWRTPWVEGILPRVEELASARAAQTVFTRFVPPHSPVDAHGAWRRYYEHWEEMTTRRLDTDLLELLPPLAALVPPARVVDKRTYSPFADGTLAAWMQGQGVEALVISGAETDVCVLATVLSAVDLGFRIIVAEDAICGSADETHDSLVRFYHTRLSEQVEIAPVEAILKGWNVDG
ncbi:isochorismatase family cysteine hydrolase [Niveispirillum sp. KHB5.9]|uniref:isochorismatase family cysteine hydrolase n=1 Tax=Niveispirillum sp. KHB5.9 TaxID=3400269 RepID=UPI003A8AF926